MNESNETFITYKTLTLDGEEHVINHTPGNIKWKYEDSLGKEIDAEYPIFEAKIVDLLFSEAFSDLDEYKNETETELSSELNFDLNSEISETTGLYAGAIDIESLESNSPNYDLVDLDSSSDSICTVIHIEPHGSSPLSRLQIDLEEDENDIFTDLIKTIHARKNSIQQVASEFLQSDEFNADLGITEPITNTKAPKFMRAMAMDLILFSILQKSQ